MKEKEKENLIQSKALFISSTSHPYLEIPLSLLFPFKFVPYNTADFAAYFSIHSQCNPLPHLFTSWLMSSNVSFHLFLKNFFKSVIEVPTLLLLGFVLTLQASLLHSPSRACWLCHWRWHHFFRPILMPEQPLKDLSNLVMHRFESMRIYADKGTRPWKKWENMEAWSRLGYKDGRLTRATCEHVNIFPSFCFWVNGTWCCESRPCKLCASKTHGFQKYWSKSTNSAHMVTWSWCWSLILIAKVSWLI